MSELVANVAATVGLDHDVAKKAIGMMLGFLHREGDSDLVEKMVASVPGAPELMSAYGGAGDGGMFSGLLGNGIMGLGQQLMGLGLGMGQITTLAKEIIAVAKQHAGEDLVDQVVASVPGLSQFV